MTRSKRSARGVSLIEAIVALAVMGFGMLGIAAMQGGLRQNSDVARQRAEAVRLASDAIEEMRAYAVVNSVTGRVSYADIVTGVPATQLNLPNTVNGINAVFTRQVTVTDSPAQNRKTVEVRVTWVDRADHSGGTTQEVRLATEIHRTPPELAGALIVPATGTMTQNPGRRHRSIPPQATANANGTSTFTPPGAPPGLVWVFNNNTGNLQQACPPSQVPCLTNNGRLLSGYISFATGLAAATAADAEAPSASAWPAFVPPSTLITLNLTVAPPAPPSCYFESLPGPPAATTVIAYYCAIFVSYASATPYTWSGRSELDLGVSYPLATAIADTSASAFRICRYTSRRNQSAVGTGTPGLRNSEHPYNYVGVRENLVNQNFLVIRAGDGITAFDCPDDDPLTPLVDGRTWHHQPAT